jgi:hypothetical protein
MENHRTPLDAAVEITIALLQTGKVDATPEFAGNCFDKIYAHAARMMTKRSDSF